jgi:hypothetical protein
MLAFFPRKRSFFGGAGDATSNGLIDVNVLDAFIIFEVFDRESNSPQ